MTSKHKIKCLNCGKCCKVLTSLGEIVDCQWLIRYTNGKTRCSIYHHRIGAIVGETINGMVQDCQKRENRKYYIRGCPYNKAVQEKWQDFPKSMQEWDLNGGGQLIAVRKAQPKGEELQPAEEENP